MMRAQTTHLEPLAALLQARRAASALLELRDAAGEPPATIDPGDLGDAIEELCDAASELPHDEPLAVAAALVAGCYEQSLRATRTDSDRAIATSALELAYATLYHALGSGTVERGQA